MAPVKEQIEQLRNELKVIREQQKDNNAAIKNSILRKEPIEARDGLHDDRARINARERNVLNKLTDLREIYFEHAEAFSNYAH